MMKGIWFDEIHSYDDLNLVLSAVNMPPAIPKTNFIDIPGGDGSVDLTEALGEVRYKNREGSFTFTVFPTDDFEEKKSEVSNLLNGKRCKIQMDKDPDYYYLGRCIVDGYASDRKVLQIVVKFTVYPYKLKTNLTTVTVPAGEDVVRNLQNGRKTAVPTFQCNANATIIFNGVSMEYNAGTHKDLNIALKYGDNQITVTSEEPVVFTYQEGDL